MEFSRKTVWSAKPYGLDPLGAAAHVTPSRPLILLKKAPGQGWGVRRTLGQIRQRTHALLWAIAGRSGQDPIWPGPFGLDAFEPRAVQPAIGAARFESFFFSISRRRLIVRVALTRAAPAWGLRSLGHGDPPPPMDWPLPLPAIRRGPKIYRSRKSRGTALLPTVAFPLRIKLCFAWGRIAGRARAVARAPDRRIMASQACKISRLGLNIEQLREYAPKSIRGTHKTETSRGSPKPGLQRPSVLGWTNGAFSLNVPPERRHPCAEGCSRRRLQRRRPKPPHNTIRRGRAVSKALKKTVRRRKPTLSTALKAAKAVGETVKSATIEDGKVTLVFGSGESVASTNDDWDRKLEELERGKH